MTLLISNDCASSSLLVISSPAYSRYIHSTSGLHAVTSRIVNDSLSKMT